MPGKRRSYILLRPDLLVVHTKPITREEAEWLYWDAYSALFLSRESRARYLAEHGNVLDVGELVRRLRAAYADIDIYNAIKGLYEDPEELRRRVGEVVFSRGTFEELKRRPEARRALEELLDRVGEFLARPVEPRPVDAPVRYLEMNRRHVTLASGPDGALREVRPKPEWYACKELCCESYGVSVFRDSFWLWWQIDIDMGTRTYFRAVVARRGADDGEVVAALAGDGAVQGFLRWHVVDAFRDFISEREEEMRERGYGDVVRKVKVILAAAALLKAGRHREGEEGEALPA